MTQAQTPQLDPQRLQLLRALADRTGIPIDELLRQAVDDLVARAEPDAAELARKIIEKNAELYRRLA